MVNENNSFSDKNGTAGDNRGKDQDTEEVDWEAAFKEAEGGSKKTEVANVQFPELKRSDTQKGALDFDFILEIPLSLTVELGRSRILIRELLQLGQGSVIELTKLAGEPMDIFVNNRMIARGEVVVVNEKFGIRLTDIISPLERVDHLK
ncbi:MAG: flagellar motor switch protein FliN [Smithellaceae bacterium]|nr:flagellar motor switch protein FliN [Smithellaceae bacterium]